MPDPRDSSISLATVSLPLSLDWAQYTRTEAEFLRVRGALRGIPHGWLRSVEQAVRRANRARIAIRDPLKYRFSHLVTGTVNLQEAKYLADILENSLRHAFVQHTSKYDVDWESIIDNTPEVTALKQRVPPGQYAIRDAVLEMTSYQLTESMARHWVRILGAKDYRPGFRRLFWSSPCCRDVALFRRDTSFVRSVRNAVAHSKGLVAMHEMTRLLHTGARWLLPLGVNLTYLLELYRAKHPQFLSDIIGG